MAIKDYELLDFIHLLTVNTFGSINVMLQFYQLYYYDIASTARKEALTAIWKK